MFYSKSTGGFYDLVKHGKNIPEDAEEISKEEYRAILEGVSQGKRIIDDSQGRPVLADPSPATAAEIWEEIKSERDRRKAGGVKVTIDTVNKWFHSDTDSRIQHLGLKDKARDLLAAGGVMADTIMILNQPVQWKTMDGSFVEVTAQLAFDIVTSAGDHDAQLFAAAETHKAAMESSGDPGGYDFSAGWATVFEG